MAYIVRRNLVNPVTQLYTFSDVEHKKLVVGLGNTGGGYALNRHNAGHMALDRLADEFGVGFVTKKDLKSLVAVTQVEGKQIILAKPLTMMNLSGQAVTALLHFYKLPLSDLLVIHDELDLPFGTVKNKVGGGSAGNNGIKSVIGAIGEDFARIRIGVGPKVPEEMDTADYVLQDFSKAEQKKLVSVLSEAVQKAQDFIK